MKTIKQTSLYIAFRKWKRERRANKKYKKYGGADPHHIKQQTIINFAEKFNINILVETGTYLGEMVEAMKPHFEKIYSIELSKELYQKAKNKFKDEKNIKIIQGDSGIELGKLLKEINQPVLFWLDGHYSEGITAQGDKDTPIYEELTHIFNANLNTAVIIIDDARCFGSDPAYPSIQELSDFVKTHSPDVNIEVKGDSIRITPN